jgi:hypothetical protein
MVRRDNRGLELPAVLVLLLCVVALLGGCGSDTSTGGGTTSGAASAEKPEHLSASEQATVRQAQTEIQSYCQALTRYLARRRGPPTEDETGRAYGAVDRLAEIARTKPAATQGPTGETVRDLLGDIAEDLQGSNCAENVVARIDQILAALPAQ